MTIEDFKRDAQLMINEFIAKNEKYTVTVSEYGVYPPDSAEVEVKGSFNRKFLRFGGFLALVKNQLDPVKQTYQLKKMAHKDDNSKTMMIAY